MPLCCSGLAGPQTTLRENPSRARRRVSEDCKSRKGAMSASAVRKVAQAAPRLARSLKTSPPKASGGGHHDVSSLP